MTKRINHQEAYSADGACTNDAESFFSRLHRSEIGIHHSISRHLAAYAGEMAWREDNRRRSNGEQYLLASMRHWYIPRAGLGRGIGNAFEGSRMIRMRALLAVIVFFGLATCAQATAIIAFWSPDAVYIGADSRETSPNQAPREICKIRIAGDVVVAEAGWLGTSTMVSLLRVSIRL